MPAPLRLQALHGHIAGGAAASVTAAAGTTAGGSIELSRSVAPADIIFGCGPIVRDPDGLIAQAQINAAVDAALAAGCVTFDTAPLYGDSEDRLGHALAASPHRGKAVVITKVGKVVRRLLSNRGISTEGPQPWAADAIPLGDRVLVGDYSKAGAKKAYEESLARMGIRRCHTLRLHDPDSMEGAADQAVAPDTGIIAGLVELRAQGLIDDVSIGMNANVDHMVVTPGSGGLETTKWDPSVIIDVLKGVPAGTFDSALLACESAPAAYKFSRLLCRGRPLRRRRVPG